MAKSQVSYDVLLVDDAGEPFDFVRSNTSMKEAIAAAAIENSKVGTQERNNAAVVVIHGSVEIVDACYVRHEGGLRDEFQTALRCNYAKLTELAIQAAVIGHCNHIKDTALDGLIACPAHLGMIARSFKLLCGSISGSEDSDFDLALSGDLRYPELEDRLALFLGGNLFKEPKPTRRPTQKAPKPKKRAAKKAAKV